MTTSQIGTSDDIRICWKSIAQSAPRESLVYLTFLVNTICKAPDETLAKRFAELYGDYGLKQILELDFVTSEIIDMFQNGSIR